jgi:hypothetical protein
VIDRRTVRPPWWLLPVAAATIGLAILHWSAPSYLLHRGYPLDDAWIHAVYARELARSGLLAYNPGVPATGETSPLWAMLLAIVHKLVASGPSAVALTKLTGYGLHLATTIVLGFALQPLEARVRGMSWIAAALVAVHPELLAASISGMEVPLATLVGALIVMASVRGRGVLLFVLGGVALVARPEGALIASLFPGLFWLRDNPRRSVALAAAAGCGSVLMLAVTAWRNYTVSGLLMPATFHVKANRGSPFDLAPQLTGFVDLLGTIAAVDSVIVLLGVGAIALLLLVIPSASAAERGAGALFTTGLLFCAVSFFLVPPTDPAAFYHQRYVLPALPLLLTALPLVLEASLSRLSSKLAMPMGAAAVIGLGALLVTAIPARAARLANDAHNIDDVQVAFGRALAQASDSDVLWTIDAGGPRYFGRPYVVDLIGLNTPEMLRPDRDAFLAAHQPRFLDVFPGWSSVRVDPHTPLPARAFETTTPYTVTSAPTMRVHVLQTCQPPGTAGWITVRSRSFPFVCPS